MHFVSDAYVTGTIARTTTKSLLVDDGDAADDLNDQDTRKHNIPGFCSPVMYEMCLKSNETERVARELVTM
jgi:hypothetical protein